MLDALPARFPSRALIPMNTTLGDVLASMEDDYD
jgi:hypothetical protein